MDWSGTWDPTEDRSAYPPNNPADLFSGWAIMDKDEEFEMANTTCREFLAEHFPFPKTPFTFLELGCSNGWLTRWVANHHPQATKLVGIDVAPLMIDKATGFFAKDNPDNCTFLCSDLMDYDPPAPVDVLYGEAVLYYCVPMEKMASKIPSWIAPGGLFGTGTDYYKENPKCQWWSEMMNIPMDMRPAEGWKKLFSETFGLENVQQVVIKYAHQSGEEDVGTLFTWGYRPQDPVPEEPPKTA